MFLGFWSHMNSLSIRQFVRQDACILDINFKWMNEGWGCLIRCGHYMTLPGLPLPGQAEDLAKHARWDWAQAASRAAFHLCEIWVHLSWLLWSVFTSKRSACPYSWWHLQGRDTVPPSWGFILDPGVDHKIRMDKLSNMAILQPRNI